MSVELAAFTKKMNQWGENGIPFLFIIDYEMNNPIIITLTDAAKNGIFYSIGPLSNVESSIEESKSLFLSKKPVDFEIYQSAFQKVMKEIVLGNTFLLNLTFPTQIEINWSMQEIFAKSSAPYRLLYKDQFVTFSPESFVQLSNGQISSFPMKGTIDAAVLNAKELILGDLKEKAEHATIVDLIRNDLSRVANNVFVKRYRYVQEIVTNEKTLLQISSEIVGNLESNYLSRIGDIVCTLLPAGSICGAPKESTLKIIRETEIYSRGFYSGVFGIFDGKTLDSAVMIRFIEKIGSQYYFKSGGGITMNSDVKKEFNELIDKVYVTAH